MYGGYLKRAIYGTGYLSFGIYNKIKESIEGVWILATNFWNDSGKWIDSEIWND